MTRRLVLVVLAAAGVAAVAATAAWAFYLTGGAGQASASVGSLAAPTSVAATVSGTDVLVTWAGSAPAGDPGFGFFVARMPTGGGPAVDVCGSPSSLLAATPDACTDPGVTPGTYTYAVTAVTGSWTATGAASDPVVVGPGATITSLALSSTSATFGDEDAVSFTVGVEGTPGVAPTGTVTVASGPTVWCTIALPAVTCVPGAAAADASDTPLAVTASYGGDAGDAGSTSPARDLTVDPDTTTTTVSSSTGQVTVGGESDAVLGVTVTTGYGEPLPATDESAVVDAGPASCPAALTPRPGGAEGSCSLGDTDLAAGPTPVAVTASYGGDDDLVGSGPATDPDGLTVYAAPVITTTSLAPAWAGEVGYSQTLTATGGAPGYYWAVTGGTVSPTMALDPSTGVLSGSVPVPLTTRTLTITLFDGDGVTDTVDLTLAVSNPFVHQTSRGATGNVGTFTVTLASAVTAGHALVLSVVQPCALADAAPVHSPVVSVAGDAASWSRAVATGCSASGDAELWYALHVPASPAGSVVTVTLATPATVASADVTEYAGVSGWDTTSGASGSAGGVSSAVSPGTSTPGAPDELIVSDAYVAVAAPASLTGLLGQFAPLAGAPPFHGIAGYLVDGTTAGCTYTFVPTVLSVPTPGNWSAAVAAFTLAG